MRRVMACALLTLSLVMTACEMRAEVTVNEDGSGTFGFAFGLEPIFMRAFPPGTEGPLELFEQELKDSKAPWTTKRFSEPGLEGVRATLRFQSVEHLRDLLEDLEKEDDSGALFGGGDNVDDGIVIAKLDEGWSFRARGVTEAAKLAEKNQGSGTDVFAGSPFEDELDKAFRFEFHVTLPGQPLSHNATEVERVGDKTRFLWRTGMYDEETLDLRAQTEPITPGLPIVPAAVVVVVIGGAIMFLKRERPSGTGGAPPVVLEGLPVVVPVGATVGAASGDVRGAGDASEPPPVEDYSADLP